MSTKYTDTIDSDFKGEDTFEKYIPFWRKTDLDNATNRYLLIMMRFFQAVYMTQNMVHPDEYWQSIEVAYDHVYGGVELPWEWHPKYRLRSTLYPYYLISFLSLIKFLQIDYAIVVRLYPYVAHSLLVILSDQYLWKVGLKTVGRNATRIGFIFYVTNRVYNEVIIRCFGNSVEAISYIIAFNYFLDVKDKFNKTTAIMTALISLSFMIRSTSPIGWIPLLLLKIVQDKSFFAFLKAGFFIAIPLVTFCIYLDTTFYGEFTVTGYNFLKVNILEGVSRYFGTEPPYYYVFVFLPLYFTSAYPSLIYAIYNYYKECSQKKQTPYMVYMTLFYVLIFSLIAHKEYRFMQPIIPFCFLMLGYLYANSVKNYGKIVRTLLWLHIIEQLVTYVIIHNFHFRQWETMRDLADMEEAPHSIFSMQKADLPYYSWTHRKSYGEGKNRTELILYKKDPPAARMLSGVPYQVLHDHDYNGCLQMIDDIEQGIVRPQYIITFEFLCSNNFYCWQVCQKKFDSLGYYTLYKSYKPHMDVVHSRLTIYWRTRYLYKLKDEYEPYGIKGPKSHLKNQQ
ncbi:UNKNOWN [Stylonychia lemnae]|uniref:Mannosyltransferase n=1 Tax=Stylonychia lemnae TaxID=5949 RepID=A0A078A4W9_STYLE|nr:UNKNOWN [Stylonychia lemnae]|eukprot:CDW76889.1 UNKNOWN [Stylonychia lemnae]